jgi:hypothetical protein
MDFKFLIINNGNPFLIIPDRGPGCVGLPSQNSWLTLDPPHGWSGSDFLCLIFVVWSGWVRVFFLIRVKTLARTWSVARSGRVVFFRANWVRFIESDNQWSGIFLIDNAVYQHSYRKEQPRIWDLHLTVGLDNQFSFAHL